MKQVPFETLNTAVLLQHQPYFVQDETGSSWYTTDVNRGKHQNKAHKKRAMRVAPRLINKSFNRH
ncbi:hypothetical protein Smp_135090 [Schistosoma mansoni]|uniref:hypothetical protein n=1 Tax=Schistosoma mansoni TaxID=6183 RepID=UPI0001A62FFC|nr:hypothetical protein Smp_135090 [Schistosoma mansoni]|eukprot:XP_018650415.1 hypothetical protein Smp_135090 [Schistosoma mansoni]